jgi:hypothetical protein
MKRFLIIILHFTIGIKLIANIVPMWEIMLSELYFDESGNWKLEIEYVDLPVFRDELTIDSMFLYSSTDTVRVPIYFLKKNDIYVITADSLESEFRINRNGDRLGLITYVNDIWYGAGEVHSLVFGDYPGAEIGAPRQNQSLARFWSYWVKNNSPSIGYPNDTTGMCGTLEGIVYDKSLKPVSNLTFQLNRDIPFLFETSETGEFSARVLSMPTIFGYTIQRTDQTTKSISIEDLIFDMEPDSVVFRDIYLKDDLITGIFSPLTKNNPVSVYPNPLSVNEKLTVKIDLPVLTADIRVEIRSLDGKLISQERITDSTSLVSLPGVSGIYIVTVLLERQRIWSGRVMVKS